MPHFSVLLTIVSSVGANFLSPHPFEFSTSCKPLLKTTTTQISTTPYHPMAWSFEDVTHRLTQEQWFNEIKNFTTYGLPPIHFPRNDSTADYFGERWHDACYERFKSLEKAVFVLYWEVECEMYCEVVSNIYELPAKEHIPSFEMKYLTRIERAGNGCI